MPGSHTQPRSVVFFDSALKTSTRRIYGYEPYCACGWRGHVWRTHRESQLERSFHKCEATPQVSYVRGKLKARWGTEAS